MNPIQHYQRQLANALSRDQRRLRQLLARLRRAPADAAATAALEQALAASIATRAARAAALPTPKLDDSLPIAQHAERIVDCIRRHPVVVIAGETGSGKTTQLPQLCLAAGRGAAGIIGCTQPRRIAARSVANRVASELGVNLGSAVGYQVRFTERTAENTCIKFMTDGILLAEIQSDRMLSNYDTIILDEAHERSLNIDFLLGYLKTLLVRRRDLKLVVTSATIDTERFSRFFDDAPVIAVEGRTFPVEVRYRPPQGESGDGEDGGREPVRDTVDAIVAAVDELTREDPFGDVLVFLAGEREIRDTHLALERRKHRATSVLALYARLSTREQDRVFNPEPGRRIVLATNVAETSLTVPRIRYVIDPGFARVKRYSPRQKLDRLHIEPIARASADQRKGRCGRVAAGVCIRLYAESDYLSRSLYTDPEIRRSSLAGVILRMLDLGLGNIEDFPFLEPPDGRAIADGWQQLQELGAVDHERKLSATGRKMARLPVDVKLARMLAAACEHGCLRETTVIAAFLGIADPRERPAQARQAADTAHAQFNDGKSEFTSIYALWLAYREAHEALTQSALRNWCEKHFLSFLRMREWRELHRQLLLMCEQLGWSLNAEAAGYADIHRALITGLPTQIGHRLDKGQYEGPRGRRYSLFPGSPLSKAPPPWVLSAVLLDTQRVWGLVNARIEPDWVIAQVPHLLARKHFDPHWSRAQGRVLASEQISLFGLVLAPKRPVHYGSIAPLEAFDLFVRQGLVTGEINTRAGFLARNLAMLEQARDEEAKLRRAGLVADEDWQARWYLDRIPADICTAVGLDAWYRKLPPAQRKNLEWPLSELLPGEGSEADRFPRFLRLGDTRLALSYRFEPGAADDGVTLELPLHLLGALDGARLDWLVPGLVEDKASALIRSLPKALRRNYVPAPDFARAFAQAWPQPSADSLGGELARFLGRVTGAPLAATDFDRAALPIHLQMNLRVRDSSNTVLAEGRDLDALRADLGERAERAFARHAGEGVRQHGLRTFPADGVPETISGEAGLPAYPALCVRGDEVQLEVFADAERARAEHRRGVRALLRIALAERLKQLPRQLPVSAKLGLVYSAIESAERLRGDLIEAAFAALTADAVNAIRTAETFAACAERIGRELLATAVERLQLAETILAAYVGLKSLLEPPLMGWASASYADMHAQLAALVYPSFLRETPEAVLPELPRYLRAIAQRAERVRLDPQRDQARLLELTPFLDAFDAAREAGVGDEPRWQALRWNIEELRVSLFAQSLGTRQPISVKRLARELEHLKAALPSIRRMGRA
ncbi:MAG: ATP-dependent RNA helicase HrpA [Gammaproteobacteria bacterium HGW-Gammaproteobacteria-4]|nr:MAG: ATP-dependent RNA helicase HrpA [Gammaproteobacteria bacterium HGW-Gammaproteobacteria-4]